MPCSCGPPQRFAWLRLAHSITNKLWVAASFRLHASMSKHCCTDLHIVVWLGSNMSQIAEAVLDGDICAGVMLRSPGHHSILPNVKDSNC